MTELPRIGCDELAEAVRQDVEQALRKIVQSVNGGGGRGADFWQ